MINFEKTRIFTGKTTFVLLGLFLIISINLTARDILRPEKITLEQFTEEYLPDYSLKKRIPIDTREINGFAVAKNTGNIAIVIDHNIIKYFDIDGNLLWEKEFPTVITPFITISDNGEIITIYGHFKRYSGDYKSIVLSVKGKILMTKVFDSAGLVTSPNGKYLYFNKGTDVSETAKGFKLFDTNFNRVKLTGFDIENLVNVDLKFVSDDKIIMYAFNKATSGSHYYLLSIDEKNNIRLLWKYEVETPSKNHPLYLYEDVRVNNDKIIINSDPIPVYVFNFAGELLYKNDAEWLHNFAFINEQNIYLQRTNYPPKIINLKTKNVEEKRAIALPGTKLQNILLINDNYLFQKSNLTSIINKYEWNNFKMLNRISKYLDFNNDRYYIFVKDINDPEISIYERGSK